LKYSIEDYINKYQFKINNQMPNMFNNNFRMGMNINSMPNMVMNSNFNFMPNMMINNNIKEEVSIPGPKIQIIFSSNGKVNSMQFNYGTTIDQTLEKYLKKVGRPELYGRSDKISFLYNAYNLRFGDKTPVEQFFKGKSYYKVIVNEITLIGG